MTNKIKNQIPKHICFACNKETNNWKFEAETNRYFGECCAGKTLKCHKCKAVEFENMENDQIKRTNIALIDWQDNKLLCGKCYDWRIKTKDDYD